MSPDSSNSVPARFFRPLPKAARSLLSSPLILVLGNGVPAQVDGQGGRWQGGCVNAYVIRLIPGSSPDFADDAQRGVMLRFRNVR